MADEKTPKSDEQPKARVAATQTAADENSAKLELAAAREQLKLVRSERDALAALLEEHEVAAKARATKAAEAPRRAHSIGTKIGEGRRHVKHGDLLTESELVGLVEGVDFELKPIA